MNFIDILLIILILDIAGILHIVCIKKNYLSILAIPLSQRLFWDHKTWRWLIIMSFATAIIGSYFFSFIFSFLLWLLWILGELPNSYIKRKLSIAPWAQKTWVASLIQYLADTFDSVVVIAVFLLLSFDLSWPFTSLIIVLWALNHAVLDSLCYFTGIKKMNYPHPAIIFFQIIVWLFFQTQRQVYLQKKRFHIHKESHEKIILIANHVSKLDPFLLCTSLDWSTTKKLIPYRFMVSTTYTKRPWMNFLLKLVWGYPAYRYNSEGKNMSLQDSRTFLERGETLVIFPEWGITHKNFWVGAFYLNQKVKDSHLELFRIEKYGKKYRIEYRWRDHVGQYGEEDLKQVWKKIFNTIHYEREHT